jgi:hypothetical protein
MKKLNQGIRRDERPIDRPDNSWSDAQNIIINKQFDSKSVENGALNITPVATVIGAITYHTFPVNKIVIGTIPTNIETVYFFAGNNVWDGEIGLIDITGNYRRIVQDSPTVTVLRLDINFPVKGTFQYKYNNELIIAYTDYNNTPKLLNTSCIPFRLNSDLSILLADKEKAINLLQQFPNLKTPLIINETDLKVGQGLGTLTTGVYYPIVSYELTDGTSTFWCKVFNAVPIYLDSTSNAFTSVGGGLAGMATNKYIDITFSNVDINFKYLKVGYLYKKDGITSAWFNNKYLINNSTVRALITGNETELIQITVDEVLIPNAIYTKAKAITNLQGKLYQGNLEEAVNINLQNIANLVTIEWIREKNISLNDRILNNVVGGSLISYGSYKDPSMVFFNKSFKTGECYAFYLVGKTKTGLYTEAFHIPGRIVTPTDRTLLNGSDPEIDAIDNSGVQKFQIQDTTTSNGIGSSSGQMGAWENQDEYYPLDTNGINIHPDYSNVPGIGTNLIDRKVRHHVFPELRVLKGYGEDFQKPTGTTLSCNYGCTTLSAGTYSNPDFEHLVIFYTGCSADPSPCYTVARNGDNTDFYTFTKKGIFTMTFDYRLLPSDLATCMLGSPNPQCIKTVATSWVISLNSLVAASYYHTVNFSTSTSSNTFPTTIQTFDFVVVPGDVIEINNTATITRNISSNPTDSTYNCGSNYNINDFTGCFKIDFTSVFFTRDVDSEILGIKISNLNISQDMLDQLDSWEIYYAKRTQTNIRIVAQDMIKDARFHNFDLISTQVVAQAKYLKPQLVYTGTTPGLEAADTVHSPTVETAYSTEEFKVINNFQYCGENTSIPQANANRATNIFIAAGLTSGVPNTDATQIESMYGYTNTLMDICIYKKSMYGSFDIQELIPTGASFLISSIGVQPAQKVFGGDIYINIFGFRPYTTRTSNFLLTCESASNIGLRTDDPILGKQYYPKFAVATSSYYGYNKDYNALNEFISLIKHGTNGDCNTDKISKFHNRVIYSIADGNESRFLNWRIFKVNDYYEMPKNKGVIWSLLGVDRKLYIHHEYSLFIAGIKDSIGIGNGEAFLKSSEVFDRPPVEVFSTNEGLAGTQSHFAILYCKLGYCFIDRNAHKVYIFNDSGLKEVSKEGLYNFFKTHGQTSNPDMDNPYIGNGYMMAFDSVYDRLVITKKDAQYEFTLSFCDGIWVSFHTYKPHVLTYNRNGLFAIDNTSTPIKLFKHDNPLTKCIFYDGLIAESYIDVPFNMSPEITKVLTSINWLSDIIKNDGSVQKDETITHLIVFNNNQCSGIIDLKEDKNLWYGKDAKNVEDTWNFNNFRDIIKNKDSPIFDNKNQLILSNINNFKAWFDKSRFISKFVIVRFISDNISQNDLHIIGVNATFKKSDRI